jgi:hypothetical protein
VVARICYDTRTWKVGIMLGAVAADIWSGAGQVRVKAVVCGLRCGGVGRFYDCGCGCGVEWWFVKSHGPHRRVIPVPDHRYHGARPTPYHLPLTTYPLGPVCPGPVISASHGHGERHCWILNPFRACVGTKAMKEGSYHRRDRV